MPLLQCGQDADGHMHAGAGIADGRHHIGRRLVGESGGGHGAAHGLGDRLEALEAAVGPVGAKALDGGIDQPRVDLGQRVVAKAETIECARAEVLQEHVGLRDDLLEQLLAGFRLQIERQALLVGIEDEEEEAVAVLAARHVAALGILELDDLGAEKPRICAQAGPAWLCVMSTTRTPDSACCMLFRSQDIACCWLEFRTSSSV